MSERPVSGLDRMRETVAIRVQSTSLRSVARQVGMSPSGLEKFLGGGTPYVRGRQKLQDWWERDGSKPRSDLTAASVETAIGSLVRDLPPAERPGAIRLLIDTLRAMYDDAPGAAPPAWLADLAGRWLAPPPGPDDA